MVAVCGAAETVTFHKQPGAVGQRMVQTACVHTRTVQTYEQSNQIISSEDRDIRNTQSRHITTVSTEPPIVDVAYARADVRIGKNRFFAKKEELPVDGKTYRVSRVGETLKITDVSGSTPPPVELRIVEKTMSWVGRPNELAEFLNGRTVTKGDRLTLPPPIADRMFGGAVGMQSIQQATLALEQIKRIHGHRCGHFRVMLTGTPSGDTSKQVTVEGVIAVQIDTCRTVVADVASDLDIVEVRGPKGATFTVRNTGKVELLIKAEFDKSL